MVGFLQAVFDFFQNIYAVLAVMPIVPFLIIFIVFRFIFGNPKQAVRLAVDITMPLLFGCVAALINVTFGSLIGAYILLFIILLCTGLLGKLHFDKYGEIIAKKLFLAVWRISFFVLAFFYVLLMLFGLVKSLILGL